VQRVENVDESLFIEDGNAVFANENKLGMRHCEFLTVCGANGKGPKAPAQSLFQLLHIHAMNLL
jgi:hypothetical protein